MEYSEIKNALIMVPAGGGDVWATTADDSNPIWKVGFLPGIHKIKHLTEYMAPDMVLNFSTEVTPFIQGANRVKRAVSEHATDTGANQDFKPTLASVQEARMRKLVSEVTMRSNSLDAQLKAAQRAMEMKQAAIPPAPESEPVLEVVDDLPPVIENEPTA